MVFKKINKAVRILLGIDFLLLLLSVVFMKSQIFGLSIRQLHVIFGITLLILGTIHIASHFIIKKK